jgi:acetoin utilization protein AcuB
MKHGTAADNMSRTIVTIAWNQPIQLANDLMEEHRIRHLPVTDKEGFVIGIISDRDVNRAMNPKMPSFSEDMVVGDFMSWPAVTVDENISLADVAEGMVDEKVSAFLVTRGGKEVVGIVTSEDLLRYLKEMLRRSPTKTAADQLPEREKKGISLRDLPYTPIVREAINELQSAGI